MQELDIRAIFAVLLSRLKWIILVTVVTAAIGGAYAKFMLSPTYQSSCEMYVSNYNDLKEAHGASAGNLSSSNALVKEFVVVIKNDLVISDVAAELKAQGYSLSNGAIRGSLSLSSVDETAMLKIVANTGDPYLCKAICDAVQKAAPAKLMEIMEMGSIKTMAPAGIGYQTGPNNGRYVTIGAVLGFVLTCGIILLIYILDTTVKDERDLKMQLNVTVLGEVPSLTQEKKGGKKRGSGK